MKNPVPETGMVIQAIRKFVDDIIDVERVTRGYSTYIFRVGTKSGVYYARFLPEDASFAAEALVHNALLEKGVIVPRVIAWEHKNAETGLSLMITEEIPGVSVEDIWPGDNARTILNEAGRQLALINEVPVDGFGWIDRDSFRELKGEKASFTDFFSDGLAEGLKTVKLFDFTDMEINRIIDLIETAGRVLDTENAVLIHGDFDTSHIFYMDGKYTGIIDFGEIRGCSRLGDLATCLLFDGHRNPLAYEYVLEGYREKAQLTDDDLYGIELFALYITVMGMRNRESRPRLADFFYTRARELLERTGRYNG